MGRHADCYSLLQRDPPGPISEVAWPRPRGSKHILLFGPGCPAAEAQEKAALARKLAIEVPTAVLGSEEDVHILPNGADEYHDPRKVSLASYTHRTNHLLI